MTRLGAALLLALLAAPVPARTAPDTIVLENRLVRATLTAGRLASLVDVRSGDGVHFGDEAFSVTIDGHTLSPAPAAPAVVQSGNDRAAYAYHIGGTTITATYELQPGWGFVSKRIRIEPAGAGPFRVNEVGAFAATMTPLPAERLPLSAGTFGMIYRLPPRGTRPGTSVFLLYQNPYNVFATEGARIRASYAPELDWTPSAGAFESDRLLIGLASQSGRRIPATAVPEWTQVIDYDAYLREHPTMDAAESDALVDAVRAFLLVRPSKSTRVHVPWCENDYQIDVATPEGWTEYQRILTMASELGAGATLFTPSNSALASPGENRDAWGWEHLLFFALGQKIRTGQWTPGRDPVPAALRSMIDAGAARGLKYVAYAYPTLPFLQDPAWTAWAGSRLGGTRGVDTGQRGFQDWWVDTLVSFVQATGAAGFSFDHWWIAYDDPAATSRYAQWYGARRILEALRRRLPDVVIDGRQQYMNFGPWTWLAGSYPHPTLTDEQPESFVAFPDLHTDRVSADRQRFAAWKYRVERFAPPEIMPGFITHQTERSDASNVMRRDRFRPRDWDVLGWQYSLLSSIGTAPFNHVINFIPARDEDEFKALGPADKAFFRRWLDWTDAHADVLRRLAPILGPPMIGRVDGTAAIAGDRGFVFIFNPNYRALDAHLKLDPSIGLTRGSRFLVKELHPDEGRLVGKPGAGVWSYGDDVRITMGATEARVFEIAPAPPAMSAPRLFNATGQVTIDDGTIAITGVTGEPGTSRDVQVALPRARTISRVTVNGTRVAFQQNRGMIDAAISFDGRAFGRGYSLFPYDPAFTGGRLSGSVMVPSRIFTQLAERRAAWPVNYTPDDLRAPWLGSHRLLLFVQIAEPDDQQNVTLTIDGQAVALTRAYNSIYGHQPTRTFLGLYADVSALAPDVGHRVELQLPTLRPGQFQGLFVENVEPERTGVIR